MKKVFKYGTGHPIPEGAVYLSTVVEPDFIGDFHKEGGWLESVKQKNTFVWHYFLVEVE